MTEIKFITGWFFSDIPSLLPIINYMGIKDLYGEDRSRIKEYAPKFGLMPKSLSEIDKSDLVASSWSPLMKVMSAEGYKNTIFIVHGVCNSCGCIADGPADRYELLAGNLQRNFRVRSGKNQSQVFAVGYPRLDELAKHPAIDLELRQKILGNTKPTILWAPPGAGVYVKELMPIMEKFATNNDINVILKLHSGGGHYEFKNKLTSKNIRIVWDEEYSSTPLKIISDVLLTGKSSVAYGFTLTDRPVIVYNAMPNYLMTDHTDIFTVGKKEGISSCLIDAIDSPQNYVNKEERLNMRKCVFSNIGCATEKAAECLKEIVEKI